MFTPRQNKTVYIIGGLLLAVLLILVAVYLFFSFNNNTNLVLSANSNETVSVNTTSQSSSTNVGGDFLYTTPWDKNFFDLLYKQKTNVPDIGPIKGGIVPHHLVGGYLPATMFDYLKKQNPSLIVLFSPNHFNKGSSDVLSELSDYQSPYGTTKVDADIINNLTRNNLLAVDSAVFKNEHGIYDIIPFIKASLPNAKVAPIIFKYTTPTSTIDKLLAGLLPLLPADAVIIASIDFSHYQTLSAANFHDELSENVIRNFEFDRINKTEIDSPASLYALMRSMQYFGAQKIGFNLHDNAANVMSRPETEETTSYFSPYFISGAVEKENTASILFFGDMMLDRSVKKQIDLNGPNYLFTALAGQENRFFAGMDLISANLEGPFADKRRPTSKEIAFRFDPILLSTLKKYHFGIFSQANNHTYDMAAAGFEESKKNLAKAGFDFYGSQYQVNSSSLLVKKVGDYNIGFIGLNDTNSPIDVEQAKNLITEAKQNRQTDFVVINLHWGAEYKEISNTRQRDLGHKLIDAGADVIIGHHPHVVQEMEIYKNRPIFYSLGNFIFDQYFSIPTQQGLSVGLVFKDKTMSISVFPLEQTKSQPRQMPYAKRVEYFNNWLKNCRLNNNQFSNFNLLLTI